MWLWSDALDLFLCGLFCLLVFGKKKILQDSTANCFLSPCEIDLKHFHGGFPPVFNKTSKPISIHFCHQFLLPFSFAFCLRRFTGSRPMAGGGGGGIGTGVYQLVI